jgi:hypothetical protein
MSTNATYPLRNVSSQHGATMGRPNTLPDDRDSPILLSLVRLPFQDGDYDKGGAYWGFSPSAGAIYRAVGERDGDDLTTEVFVRAKTRADARAQIVGMIPGARFYR